MQSWERVIRVVLDGGQLPGLEAHVPDGLEHYVGHEESLVGIVGAGMTIVRNICFLVMPPSRFNLCLAGCLA